MFDFGRFMDELAAACKTVDGINRTYAWPANKVEPPCAVIGWPTEIDYDETYGGTQHDYVVPVFLFTSMGNTPRVSRDRLANWISRDIKVAIDDFEYTDSPIAVVTTAESDVVELAGTQYMTFIFSVDVTSTT